MIELIYKYKCDLCKEVFNVKCNVHFYEGVIPKPSPPNDWIFINRMLICKKHTIIIDGEKIKEGCKNE